MNPAFTDSFAPRSLVKLGFGLIVLVLAAAACKTTPKPARWEVSVRKATPASIEVDLVGVSAADKPYWQNSVKVDDYFKPNNSIRSGAKRASTNFREGDTWVLHKDDAIWNDWLGYGATDLMVIANLPGKHEAGPFDRRRVFVPLDKNAWKAENQTLRIEIQEEFIRVLTPQQPQR